MKITFHIGAHRTDHDRLLRSLIRNNQVLADQDIHVPGKSRFRPILHEVATRLKGAQANPETVDLVLDTILDTTEARHIVLSYDAFLCGAGRILMDGGYYRRADRSAWLRAIFPGHEVRFALGIRNPATHLPEVWRTTGGRSFDEFLMGTDPLTLRWSEPIRSIIAANPGCPLIVWCNEDTPFIWPQIMQTVADPQPGTRLDGGLDILEGIIEPEGMRRLLAYLETHAPASEIQRQRILSAFLDKYAKPDEIEQVIDVPGWTAATVEQLTANYEEDVATIPGIEGVTFLAP